MMPSSSQEEIPPPPPPPPSSQTPTQQTPHTNKFFADIWSFGITALELAHGIALSTSIKYLKKYVSSLQGVVAISWCPHDSSYLPKMTALYYGTLILPRSPLNFQVGPIRILMSIGQWHPKLHGVIFASSFHGKIGIYKVEAYARYSVGEDSAFISEPFSNYSLLIYDVQTHAKRDFGSLLLVGKFNMVVPLLSRSLKVGASWRSDVTRFWSYYGTHSNKERAIANLAMNVMLKSIFLQSLPLLSHPPRCPNTRGASGNGEKPTGICQCRSQQHIDGGGANVRLHSAGLSLASTTNGDSLNTLTFVGSIFILWRPVPTCPPYLILAKMIIAGKRPLRKAEMDPTDSEYNYP
ncbi:hypothetical protein Tco_0469540 [Tanacetum coccineum]